MAVWNFDEFEADPVDAGTRAQRFIHLAGAATSVGLVLGLALWSYRLAVRDVNGVPVIKAIAGPMRIAPEDPGGQVAGNVGLSVNRIAAGDAAQPTPDGNITLAPAPVALGPSDSSPEVMAAQKAAAAPVAPAPTAGDAGSGQGTSAQVATQGTTAQVAAQVAAPDASAGASSSLPVAPPLNNGSTTAATTATTGPAATTAADAVPVSGTSSIPGGPPVRSPVPQMRPRHVPTAVASDSAKASNDVMPADVAAAAAAAVAALASAPPVAASVSAASLKPGTPLAQLGAFPTEADAVKVWNGMKGRFVDLMADKSRVVQKASSGGRAFYRLRAYGFHSSADTRRFCAALKAESATCVPVVLR